MKDKIVKDNFFSENFQDLVDAIGADSAIQLCKAMGGLELYIPKYDTVTRAERNKEIVDKFTGYNHSNLAREYNLSKRQIYNIVSNNNR